MSSHNGNGRQLSRFAKLVIGTVEAQLRIISVCATDAADGSLVVSRLVLLSRGWKLPKESFTKQIWKAKLARLPRHDSLLGTGGSYTAGQQKQ